MYLPPGCTQNTRQSIRSPISQPFGLQVESNFSFGPEEYLIYEDERNDVKFQVRLLQETRRKYRTFTSGYFSDRTDSVAPKIKNFLFCKFIDFIMIRKASPNLAAAYPLLLTLRSFHRRR